MYYGVAMMSRLLKIIDPFLQKSPLKETICCKKTYNFKEPTNRSHAIYKISSMLNVLYKIIIQPRPYWFTIRPGQLNFSIATCTFILGSIKSAVKSLLRCLVSKKYVCLGYVFAGGISEKSALKTLYVVTSLVI